MQLLARRVSPQALPVGRRPRGYAKKTGKNFQKRVSGFQGGAIPGSRSRDQPDSGGRSPDRDRAIGRIQRGGQFPDRERAIGRIPGGEKAIPGSGSRDQPDSKGKTIPGSRSRDLPNSRRGRHFLDRDRAIGRIPGGGKSRIAIARTARFRGG